MATICVWKVLFGIAALMYATAMMVYDCTKESEKKKHRKNGHAAKRSRDSIKTGKVR